MNLEWITNLGMDLHLVYIPIITIVVALFFSIKFKKFWIAPIITIVLCAVINLILVLLFNNYPIEFRDIVNEIVLMTGIASFAVSCFVAFALYIFKNRNN